MKRPELTERNLKLIYKAKYIDLLSWGEIFERVGFTFSLPSIKRRMKRRGWLLERKPRKTTILT